VTSITARAVTQEMNVKFCG